jgi:hypothetical protein
MAILFVKRQGSEPDRSSLFSAEFKYEWSFMSDPPACLRDLQKENFTLTYKIVTWINKVLLHHA